MKTKIKVTYTLPEGQVNTDVDKDIIDKIKSIGGEWYAQGADMIGNTRDICFDLDLTM